jgi:hypothetical protein
LNSVNLLAVVGEHPRAGSKQRLQRVAVQPGGQAAAAMVAAQRTRPGDFASV